MNPFEVAIVRRCPGATGALMTRDEVFIVYGEQAVRYVPSPALRMAFEEYELTGVVALGHYELWPPEQ